MLRKISLVVLIALFFLPAAALAKGGGGGGHGSSGGGISGRSASSGGGRSSSSSSVSSSSRRSSREVEARGRVAEGEIGHHHGGIEDGIHHRGGIEDGTHHRSGDSSHLGSHEGNRFFMMQRLQSNNRLSEVDKEELIAFLESQHNGPVDLSDSNHTEDVRLLEKVSGDTWLLNQQQRRNAIRRSFRGR